VVVRALARDRNGNLPVGTFAGQRSAGEIRSRRLDAIVDCRMDGE
jgi:hypothetical protein